MRINQFLAQVLGISRRAADKEIEGGFVRIGKNKAKLGDQVGDKEVVQYRGEVLVNTKLNPTTVMLNKPEGYITSRKRDETSSPTVMELLPADLQHLRPVGRLDKESCGLLLLTDDGDLLYRSTHPKFEIEKEYIVEFEIPLTQMEMTMWKQGMKLIDGIARADKIVKEGKRYRVYLHQGKNRQIRRMAGKTGNKVNYLERVRSGDVSLGNLRTGEWKKLPNKK